MLLNTTGWFFFCFCQNVGGCFRMDWETERSTSSSHAGSHEMQFAARFSDSAFINASNPFSNFLLCFRWSCFQKSANYEYKLGAKPRSVKKQQQKKHLFTAKIVHLYTLLLQSAKNPQNNPKAKLPENSTWGSTRPAQTRSFQRKKKRSPTK